VPGGGWPVLWVLRATPGAMAPARGGAADNPSDPLLIEVTGWKFWWDVRYPDAGVRTGNEIPIPVGEPVEFRLTSGDVIHAWWVYDFAVKKDAIPGFINTNWATVQEPGIYYGKCAELCGRGHGFMPVTVKAIPADEFDEWLALKQEGDDEAAEALVDAYFADNDHLVADGS
jgi:cytochrome c oxidase subunit II